MTAKCAKPLDWSDLAEYWLEAPEPAEFDRIEEHLLGCDRCGDRLRWLASVDNGIVRLAAAGAVEMVVTPSFLARAAEDGLHAREYRLSPGESVQCTVTRSDDLLVARLAGDFHGLERLDVVAEQEGLPPQRIEDVPFDPEAGELIVSQAMPQVRALGHTRHQIRLVGFGGGAERLVGAYTFNHSPTLD
jgi:hypothetical protein